MPALPPPPQTPLRRLSQGSLSRFSRSGAYPDAPHGLGFLEPALGELIDETEALQTNVEGVKNLSASLDTFNESFASWLYVMTMNALTTDWPQGPTDASFALAARRAEEDARAALEAIRAAEEAARKPPSPDPATLNRTEVTAASTDGGNETTATAGGGGAGKPPLKSALKKKAGKPKPSAKEKRERAIELDKIVSALPLEFRGGDVALRRHTEMIIEKFLDGPQAGYTILQFIRPPDLNQARVNKCLIALVNRKLIRKDNSTGAVLYHWQGVPT